MGNVNSFFANQSNSIMYIKKKNIREGKTKIIITNNLFGFSKELHEINTLINFDFPHSSFDYMHCVERIDWSVFKTVVFFIQAKGGLVPNWILQASLLEWF